MKSETGVGWRLESKEAREGPQKSREHYVTQCHQVTSDPNYSGLDGDDGHCCDGDDDES